MNIRTVWIILCLASLGLASCRSARTIYPSGLSYIQLGSEMPPVGSKSLKGHGLRDTLFNEGGYEWRAAVLKYGKHGNVYVEDGFWGEGKVNRIRVESPRLFLYADKKIRVGMDWEVLKPVQDGWQLNYLADYGLVDVFSSAFPSVHFLVKEKALPLSQTDTPELSPAQLSPDSKVVAIVIM